MSDESDLNAAQDVGQDQSAGTDTMAGWQEPNPADYGINPGADPQDDRCWEKFKQCVSGIKDSMALQQCIDQLNECRRKENMGPDAQPL